MSWADSGEEGEGRLCWGGKPAVLAGTEVAYSPRPHDLHYCMHTTDLRFCTLAAAMASMVPDAVITSHTCHPSSSERPKNTEKD